MLYLYSHFGNISSDHQTTSIGYQCNNITLIQSYQDCTWLIFPKFANSTKGEKGALHIRMHPLKHYFFDLNICFFTHVQRFAVCPIQKKMNKKPILPCTAPMGECAVNTIIRTKVTTLMASRMANIVHNHFVCLFKPFTFVSQFLLPKCKYRCSITKMNINIPRMQCKYIHVANGNPNRPSPPHASICILDSNTNKAIDISKRLHNRSFFIFSILPQCNLSCNTQIKGCRCYTQSLEYTAHGWQCDNTCTFLQL